MRVGIGEADVTPPFPCVLAGFGLARKELHEGVHDPIGAQCVVFESRGSRVALCSVEVIGLNAELIGRIRSAVAEKSGLEEERLVVVCTHTHGAPVIEGEYVSFLIERIVSAVVAALDDLRERRVAGGIASHQEWVGFNRRALESGFLPVDREIPFLVVRESDGRPRAVLYHYACHPSILGPDNLRITADWPGHTRGALRQALGDHVTVAYLKGAEGNINTGYSAGLSSLGMPIPTRTHATAARVGGVIARAVLEALDAAREFESEEVALVSRRVEIAFLPTGDLEKRRAMREDCREEVRRLEGMEVPSARLLAARVELAFAGFAVAALERIEAEGVRSRGVEQTAFRIGDAGFLSFPGEFFVESGLEMKRAADCRPAFPLCITNDYLGYFPTRAAFAEGGYEVSCARFAPETAEQWVADGTRLLNSLFT